MTTYKITREDGFEREVDEDEFEDLKQLLDEQNREYDTEVVA